jgi:hypothetical protein
MNGWLAFYVGGNILGIGLLWCGWIAWITMPPGGGPGAM